MDVPVVDYVDLLAVLRRQAASAVKLLIGPRTTLLPHIRAAVIVVALGLPVTLRAPTIAPIVLLVLVLVFIPVALAVVRESEASTEHCHSERRRNSF
jgi:hypothetical protein